MSDFARKQQEIIEREMREMPASRVNEILETMKCEEAQGFLEKIGRVRAREIYRGEYEGQD